MSTTAPNLHRRMSRAPSGHQGAPSSTQSLGVVVLLAVAIVALVTPFAMPASYSWTEHGISESAAQGVDGAWVTRTGFILFGLAVLWLTRLRRDAWKLVGTGLHGAFAVSMFAVAAFSAKSWEPDAVYVESEDVLHSVFAGIIGFGLIVGVVAVMVARRLPTTRAALPDIAAIIIPTAISLTMSTSIWGLLQRTMFLTAAAWYTREAILSRRERAAET